MNSSAKAVLVVDDDVDTGELLSEALQRRGFAATSVTSGARCLEHLRSHVVDIVIADIQMPGMTGLELVHELSQRHPDLSAIVLTGVGDLEKAVAAMRAGAYDFLSKPVSVDHLAIVIGRALEHLDLTREVTRLRHDAGHQPIAGFTGESPQIREVIELTRRAAVSDATVLISGESGTGKELVARALHQLSARASEPFVAVNCAAMPPALLESELFGHLAGAFTDAKRARGGLFAQAGAGTIFLDEIGEMPMEMQPKLLRVLQERKVRPVGGDEEVAIECRVVTATNRDLEHEVAERRFREDLFYRVNVLTIPVPPLRERGEDILKLAEVFLGRATRGGRKRLSPAAARKLLDYDWPGNVRELENCIERAVALALGDEIDVSDLPTKIAQHESTRMVMVAPDPMELITLDEMERRYVRCVLNATNNNKTHAARVLGIDRRSLYRRLESTSVSG